MAQTYINGATDRHLVPFDPNHTGFNDAFSFLGWVRVAAYTQADLMWARSDPGNSINTRRNCGTMFAAGRFDDLEFLVQAGGGPRFIQTDNQAYPIDTWIFRADVWEDVIEGQIFTGTLGLPAIKPPQVISGPGSGFANNDGNAIQTIGSDAGNATNGLTQDIAAFCYIDGALTLPQILQYQYNPGAWPSIPGCAMCHFPGLGDDSAAVARDQTGRGNNATLEGPTQTVVDGPPFSFQAAPYRIRSRASVVAPPAPKLRLIGEKGGLIGGNSKLIGTGGGLIGPTSEKVAA